jgi:hypothetical protein
MREAIMTEQEQLRILAQIWVLAQVSQDDDVDEDNAASLADERGARLAKIAKLVDELVSLRRDELQALVPAAERALRMHGPDRTDDGTWR